MNVSLDESYAYCKKLSKRTARNFYFSFLGLPADKSRAMCALYAFMRKCDDLGDDTSLSVARRSKNLDAWQQALIAGLANDFRQTEADRLIPETRKIFPALIDVVARFGIPREYLFAVIDGVRMDLAPTGFETFEELSTYCYHVAGAVGLCCIHIWGFHGDDATKYAVDCGNAFQLTNILRDLGEDIRMSRVYLPREDMRRFGYSVDDLTNCKRGAAFEELMQFEVERTRSYYRRAEHLFDYLDPTGKPILRAMIKLYGGLLDKIERRRYDVFSRPVALPKWQKLVVAAEAIIRRRWIR